jgi:hypothetical protein
MSARLTPDCPAAALRTPGEVMRLARLGAFHQTRLSFLRAVLRRVVAEGWSITRPRFDIDARGVGTAVYRVDTGKRIYALVAFGHDLPAEKRTDRVIAEAWDATFALFDGEPTPADIERLRANVPLQEAGRYEPSDLVLARANRSVRLFDVVMRALAAGRQPPREALEAVGYLMRTTAVYGNGKFGIADRDRFADRPELAGPFRAEMLTVWLIRAFTVDLVEHMASLAGPRAAPIAPELRRRIGVGNATGLGMAPFLVKHPALIDRWITARETALARVRNLPTASQDARAVFRDALDRARRAMPLWPTGDAVQASRIAALTADLARLAEATTSEAPLWTGAHPWDAIWRFASAALTPEGQEMTVSLLLEPHGALVDDLADTMVADEHDVSRIDGRITVGAFRRLLDVHYGWARATDFSTPAAQARFWYVSEEKLEPRLGERAREAGAEREQPLAVGRDVAALAAVLAQCPSEMPLAEVLLAHPEHRHAARRVFVAARYPYGEIRDNLLAADVRPIDMLRAKLSFFGCTRFDPRSDKWLRITLFQGAPYPHEITTFRDETWPFGPAA